MDQNQEADLKRFTAHIADLAERALREGQPQWTDFLEPPLREQAEAVCGWTTGVRFSSFGGYTDSERRRLVIYPDYFIAQTIEPAIACLAITVSKANAPDLTHRDYLGAILGLGLKREKLGDLLVGAEGCQMITLPEFSDFIRLNLTKVANFTATAAAIDPEQLDLPNLREKIIRTTVASLRLDAVAALGFGESRTRMAREIKAERVKVNWKPVTNPDTAVNPGDIIAIRGRGRVIFRELSGQSKKGRQGIVLTRLL